MYNSLYGYLSMTDRQTGRQILLVHITPKDCVRLKSCVCILQYDDCCHAHKEQLVMEHVVGTRWFFRIYNVA